MPGICYPLVKGIKICCHILQPSPDPSNNSDQALSTAAIVMIVVGSYLALVIIALIIRQCLKVSLLGGEVVAYGSGSSTG